MLHKVGGHGQLPVPGKWPVFVDCSLCCCPIAIWRPLCDWAPPPELLAPSLTAAAALGSRSLGPCYTSGAPPGPGTGCLQRQFCFKCRSAASAVNTLRPCSVTEFLTSSCAGFPNPDTPGPWHTETPGPRMVQGADGGDHSSVSCPDHFEGAWLHGPRGSTVCQAGPSVHRRSLPVVTAANTDLSPEALQ